MYTFRPATLADGPTILRQRRLMFTDMGDLERASLTDKVFLPWLEKNLLEGRYVGLLAVSQDQIVAGAGLLFYHWLPAPDHGTLRGYICNVYVEPEHRRKGLAKQLVQQCLDLCQERGISTVTLHASEMGKSVYQAIGFKVGNELVWRKP